MNKTKVNNSVLRFFFTVICLSILLFTSSCGNEKKTFENKLSNAITKSSNDYSRFKMLDLTDFDWDGLFIFGPYTSQDDIEKALGYKWKSASKTGIESNDGCCLIIFTKAKRVVQYLMYPRKDGDFSSISSTNMISPEEAVFSSFLSNGQVQVKLDDIK